MHERLSSVSGDHEGTWTGNRKAFPTFHSIGRKEGRSKKKKGLPWVSELLLICRGALWKWCWERTVFAQWAKPSILSLSLPCPLHSHCLLCCIKWMLFSLLHPSPAAGALFWEARWWKEDPMIWFKLQPLLPAQPGLSKTGMVPSSLFFVRCKYTDPAGNGYPMMFEPSTNGILVNFRELQITKLLLFVFFATKTGYQALV